jgi:predicted dehydrogenase
MCFSVAEGQQMIQAAEQAGVRLMVAYPKRYDPAFARLREELPGIGDLRLIRVTTLESPIPPYVVHYPLFKGSDVAADTLRELKADDDARVTAALGESDALTRQTYRMVLLDTLVHEFNTIRGIMGEPDRLDYVDFREQSVSAMFDFGGVPCALHWVDLPGIARYQMEFAFYGPDRRLTLSFPSPFLRSAPTLLTIEGGDSKGSPRAWATEETVAYDEAFKRELVAFHEYVTQDREPLTPGSDGLRDIALCQASVSVFRSRTPMERPTAVVG